MTFESLDSIKVCRGEYEPFPPAPDEADSFHWVTTISNSARLRQRYEHEKRHYGSAYNFCGEVEEMLDEFSHYAFRFHDQFVEAIAAGIWFESGDAVLPVGRTPVVQYVAEELALSGVRRLLPKIASERRTGPAE